MRVKGVIVRFRVGRVPSLPHRSASWYGGEGSFEKLGFDTMARAALNKYPPSAMTVDEFLAWDDGTDTRYELVGGDVFAMTPPAPAHGMVVFNLAGEIRARLKPPCKGVTEAGVRIPERDDVYFQADLVVSCSPIPGDSSHVPEPVLIIEVLSPSTAGHDRGTKVPCYRTVPSVEEIALLSSTAIRAELWHRTAEGWEVTDLVGTDAVLRLGCVDVEVPLAIIYEGVSFEPVDAETRTSGS